MNATQKAIAFAHAISRLGAEAIHIAGSTQNVTVYWMNPRRQKRHMKTFWI